MLTAGTMQESGHLAGLGQPPGRAGARLLERLSAPATTLQKPISAQNQVRPGSSSSMWPEGPHTPDPIEVEAEPAQRRLVQIARSQRLAAGLNDTESNTLHQQAVRESAWPEWAEASRWEQTARTVDLGPSTGSNQRKQHFGVICPRSKHKSNTEQHRINTEQAC